MEASIGIGIVAFAAITIAGFVALYQPASIRESRIRQLQSAGDQVRVERLVAKPLWRLRLVGACLLLAAFLLAQLLLWVGSEVALGRLALASTLLDGLIGVLAVGTGISMLVTAKRTRASLLRAGTGRVLPAWGMRVLGVWVALLGAAMLAGAVQRFPT